MYVLMVSFTMRNKFALCNQVGELTEPLPKTIRRWLFHVFSSNGMMHQREVIPNFRLSRRVSCHTLEAIMQDLSIDSYDSIA